jgi:cytochrome c2
MVERATLARAAAIAALLGSVLVLGRGASPPDRKPVPAPPNPVAVPTPSPSKPPPFGWAVAIAAAALLIAAGSWVYTRKEDRVARATFLTRGDPGPAPALLIRYGCASCHRITGVPAAGGLVGPALDGIADRVYIAGLLPNTPDNLVRWIVDPRTVNPHTAMPVSGISAKEARDVAAFLYSR